MPSDPQLRNLMTAPEVALFRILDSVIRADPVCKSAFKVIRSWQGRPEDKNGPASGEMPYLRLTPQGSPEQPWSPETQIGWLFINAEIAVKGYCSDDITNLWYAVKRAANPVDFALKNALTARLQAAGAHKGLVQFSAPAFDTKGGEDGIWNAVAQMKIEYRANFFS